MVATDAKTDEGVRRPIIWVVAGHGGTIVAQLAVLLTLTNYGSQTLVGEWAFAIAIATPVFLLTGLGVRQARAADVADKFRFTDYLRVRLLAIVLSALIIAIVVVLIEVSARQAMIIMLMTLIRALETVYELIFGEYQLRGKHRQVGQSAILVGLSSVVLFLATFFAYGSLPLAMLMQAVGIGLVLVVSDRKHLMALGALHETLGTTAPDGPSAKIGRSIFLTGLPLGLSAVFIWLQPNVTRFMVEHFLGLEMLGYFTVLLYAYTASQMLIVAIGHGALTRLASLHHQGLSRELVILVGKLCLFVGGLGIAGVVFTWLFGAPVLTLLFGDDYGQYSYVLLLIVAGSALRYVGGIVQFAVTAMGAFRAIMAVHIVVMAAAFVASWLLIRANGLVGGGTVVIIVNATHLVLILGVFFMLLARNRQTGEEMK